MARSKDSRRGSALLVVTVLVMVLVGLAGAFLATTRANIVTTTATEEEVLARQASAAGLDKARRLLYEVRAAGQPWTDALSTSYSYFAMSGYQIPGQAGSTTQQSGTTGSNYYEKSVTLGGTTAENTTTGISSSSFYGVNFVHGDTVYNVIVADDSDGDASPTQDANNQVVVFTTVASPASPPPNVARRVLSVTRTVVYWLPPEFTPTDAITVGGGLIMGGNPTVQGAAGSVHANGDFTVQGSVSISQQGSASGQMTIVGSPSTPAGGWVSNAATVDLPTIDPITYQDKAKYILESDGKVYDNATSPRTLIANGTWNGFSFGSGMWSRNASTPIPPPSTILIKSNVKITGGGTDATPWTTTLLVTGSIDMSGNPRLKPYLDNVTMMARGDIKIRGNSSAQPGVNGVIATHEQIDIGGTPQFTGAIVAEDAEDVTSLVSSVNQVGSTGEEEMVDVIMGNFTLTYNGAMQTFLTAGGNSVKVRSWDRYR